MVGVYSGGSHAVERVQGLEWFVGTRELGDEGGPSDHVVWCS